jgi:hypothetical protein
MLAYLCSRDERVTRLDRDGQSWAAHTVLDGVSASCVATDSRRVLVGTQGDGALLSSDGGGSWEPIELPERDVFSVAISRADGALYAGTEPSRLFVSRDVGAWTELEALQEIPSKEHWSFPPRPWTHHVRWIAPDPHVPERLLVGIELGGVMYSDDGAGASRTTGPGQSAMRTALPGTGESTPYALAAIDEVLLAAMADGRSVHSGDRGETWEETGVRIGSVLAMAAGGE